MRRSADASREWLAAGVVPGADASARAMATRALLDLRLLARPDGAVIAGWSPLWQYSWPRDASWVAVALADSGHAADALRILHFLARTQPRDGVWAARYLPDGSGPVPDGRPAELDSVGWVPWAVWSWYVASEAHLPAAGADLRGLWPMVQAAANAAVRSLTKDGLPRASMDYWEHSVQVTLGTAAPVLTGLRSAADLAAALRYRLEAARWAGAARRLGGAITAGFGRHGYGRTPSGGAGADAAVTFLGPPFMPASAVVARSVASAQKALTLANGGMLPGTGWAGNPSVAWTAETAFFALFDAATDDHADAARILGWLAAHRTRIGVVPEQVDAQGRPVSVAPLDWTDAVVVLAMLAQQSHLRVVPVPPGA